MIQNLYSYVENLGYCRSYFRSIDLNAAIYEHTISVINDNVDAINSSGVGYWLILGDNIKYPLLYKSKIRMIPRLLDAYNSKHLISSIIRNILLDNTYYDDVVKCNSVIYIYYYYSLYKYKYSSIDLLTESVIRLIIKTIEVLIEKESSLYKRYPQVSEYIDIMRLKLNSERAVNKTRGISLR